MIALLVALCTATPLADSTSQAVPTVITNVAVMDAEGHVGPRRDVLIAEGLIVGIEPVGNGWSDPNISVVDGTNRTLVPGLIDVHVHLQSTFAAPDRLRIPNAKKNLQALLYAGITTALDLSMERDAIDRLNAKITDGRLTGPQMYRSGRPYTAPNGHPIASIRALYPGLLVKVATARIAHTVETADDVDDAVFRQGQTGFKKIMLDTIPSHAPILSEESAQRVRLAATALGDRLIAHVGSPADVQRALDLGVDALAHAPSHGRITAEQAIALRDGGIEVTPTLTVWDRVGQVHQGAVPAIPLQDELLTTRQRRDLGRMRDSDSALRGVMGEWVADVIPAHEDRTANLRLLRDNDVTLLVGSDSPGLGIPAGSGLHSEMAAMLDAGLDRPTILRAVTWQNSRFLDPDARFGAIRPGWEADLLLIEGNPEHDLTALQRIVDVWTDGRRVSRHAQ